MDLPRKMGAVLAPARVILYFGKEAWDYYGLIEAVPQDYHTPGTVRGKSHTRGSRRGIRGGFNYERL